jgi:SUN domain-containing protein 1/2
VTQTFPVRDESHRFSEENYQTVSLRVLSNHGHPDYTCLYRFRVHGDAVP